MTKHFPIIELKDADPVDAVTAALDDLTKSVDERLKAIETKSAGGADAGELDALKASLAKIEARLSRPGIITGKSADETKADAETKAFGTYIRRGEKALGADEIKALNVTTAAQGGYMVPPEMSAEILRELVEYSPIRALADVRDTSKSSVFYPKRTGRPNITWLSEGEARTEEAIAFGQVEIKIKEAGFFIPVTNRLLGDSQGAAEAEVRLAIAEAYGKNESEVFLNGDGVKEPSGILTDASLVTVEAPLTAPDSIQYNSVLDTFYALPATYRNRGSWLLNSTVLKLLRKMKDEAGTYIWQPALSQDAPERILGRPVIEIPEMPDHAPSAVPVLFGDFKSAYRIVDHIENGSAFSVLVDPYTGATNGITKFHANRRVGAKLLRPEAIVGMKIAA
ncbi:phage major capsid protein [Xanthobacter autotrophicus]|uniref:phage major capsid protein n=1 Tax=Xanthobacter TaxID=279 RepID=UPI0024AB94AB|nr:phage major capsid protein [Xanthobacter autotrophicus]MDI4664340.1 phage major capsid protein [Xanthobacter autotrophicus]